VSPGEKRRRKAMSDRKYRLKKLYGLTVEQYDEMLKRQGGVCYICHRRPKRNRKLAVDHDHKHKGRPIDAVRGLLCTNCNHEVLGVVAKHWTPVMFMRAANYLANPPGAFGHPPKNSL
jgi:hypothetical protein